MSDYNDVLTALRKINRAIDLHSRRLARETGLTAPQLMVLSQLLPTGRCKPSDIARRLYLSQATISSIVGRLLEAGLVTRERGADDRRVIEVVLTERGHNILADAPELLQHGFHDQFERLESWEKKQLVSALQRMAAMMQADQLDAAPILEVGDLAP